MIQLNTLVHQLKQDFERRWGGGGSGEVEVEMRGWGLNLHVPCGSGRSLAAKRLLEQFDFDVKLESLKPWFHGLTRHEASSTVWLCLRSDGSSITLFHR